MEVMEENKNLDTGFNFFREKYKFFDTFLSWDSLTHMHREVILGLATIGVIKLQILKVRDNENTNIMDSLSFLLENKGVLEDAFFEVATSLRETNNNCLRRSISSGNNVRHYVTNRKFCRKLERTVNIVKVTVTSSKKVADRFQVSNYKYFMKMVESTFLNCPSSESSSVLTTEWSFIHECSNSATELISRESAHLLLKDLEETIGTLRKFVSQFLSSESASRSVQHFASVSTINDRESEAEITLLVAAKLLAVDLVMEEIFNNVDFESLLSSRLVSRQFNRYVIRKNKKCPSIIPTRFKYDDQSKKYLSNKFIDGVHRNLSEFTMFLMSISTATELPFSTFTFTKGSLICKDLIEFFEIHGNRIQELHIQLEYYADKYWHCRPAFTPEALAKVLSITCSIEKLVLEYLPFYWRVKYFNDSTVDMPTLFPSDIQRENTNMKMENLKSLEIKSNVRDKFFSDFLVAGCNLETCSSFESIIPFIKLNKFYLLRQLWWGMSYAPDEVEFFRALVDNNVEITSNLIDFGVYMSFGGELATPDSVWTMTKVLNKVLQSCSQTLEIFHLFTPLSNFPGLQLPFLPKVKTLSIQTRPHFAKSHDWPNSTNKFFPPGTSLPSVFPRVQKIILGFTHYKFEALPSWSDAFEFAPSTVNQDKDETLTLKTVKCIEVIENLELPVGWMEGLSILCPNVESIRINTIFYDFQDAINGLWKFRNVKNIELNIDVRVAEETPFIIDEAFTGFSVSTCQDLFNRLTRMEPEPESLQLLRVNPSLLDLKALVSLKVTFMDPHSEEVGVGVGFDFGVRRILSKVTQFYAFDLCPRLNICLSAAGRTEARSTDLLLELAEMSMSSSAHLHCPAVTVKEGWTTPYSFGWSYLLNQASLANFNGCSSCKYC